MKNLRIIFKNINNKISWQFLLLIIAIMVIGVPSLFVNWMIVDDGYYLLVSRNISMFLSQGNFSEIGNIVNEQARGRFRPMLWIYVWITYLFASNNPMIHHFITFVICALTVIFIYLIIKLLTSSKTSALVGGLIFLLAPFNLESWYRIGPIEPKTTFFLSLSLYFLIRIINKISLNKRISKIEVLLTYFPIPIIYFFKETFFVLAFLPFVFLFGIKTFHSTSQKRKWLKIIGVYFLLSLFFAFISFYINFFVRQTNSYSAYYKVAFDNVFSTGIWYLKLLTDSYGIILFVLLISFIANIFSSIKRKQFPLNQFLQFSFLAGFFVMYIIQLPWLIPMGRYFEPALFFFSLICGLEMTNILKSKISTPKIKLCIFLFGFIFMILKYFFPTYNYVRDTIIGQKNTAIMFQSLAKIAPINSHVYWNLVEWEGTEELIMEANNLLNLVYKRPDLTVVYLNENNLVSLEKGDLVFNALVDVGDQLYENDVFKENNKLTLVKSFTHDVERIYVHPKGLIGVLKAVIFKRPIPIRILYEKNVFKPQWYIYQVTK
jgi:hypothetical protein